MAEELLEEIRGHIGHLKVLAACGLSEDIVATMKNMLINKAPDKAWYAAFLAILYALEKIEADAEGERL